MARLGASSCWRVDRLRDGAARPCRRSVLGGVADHGAESRRALDRIDDFGRRVEFVAPDADRVGRYAADRDTSRIAASHSSGRYVSNGLATAEVIVMQELAGNGSGSAESST